MVAAMVHVVTDARATYAMTTYFGEALRMYLTDVQQPAVLCLCRTRSFVDVLLHLCFLLCLARFINVPLARAPETNCVLNLQLLAS